MNEMTLFGFVDKPQPTALTRLVDVTKQLLTVMAPAGAHTVSTTTIVTNATTLLRKKIITTKITSPDARSSPFFLIKYSESPSPFSFSTH